MNTKWTPGPWQANPAWCNLENGNHHWAVESKLIGAGYGLVASLEYTVFREHQEANARLIAAAPELAEALRALDKAFWPAANGWGDDIQDAIQEAHTLLSKLDLAPTEAHGKPEGGSK